MWKRQWVTVRFVVEGFKFQGRTFATVNVNKYGDLIEQYIEDPEELEDVEFVESLIDNYNEEEIPKEEELTDEDLEDIVEIFV